MEKIILCQLRLKLDEYQMQLFDIVYDFPYGRRIGRPLKQIRGSGVNGDYYIRTLGFGHILCGLLEKRNRSGSRRDKDGKTPAFYVQ